MAMQEMEKMNYEGRLVDDAEAITGKNWTKEVHFYPGCNRNDPGPVHKITEDKLIDRFVSFAGADEAIQKVTAYKVRLLKYLPEYMFAYHMFIVFKTKDWWWSIEKNDIGIIIQRSKYLEAVRDRCGQERRKDRIKSMKQGNGTCSVLDIIHWLLKTKQLDSTYHIVWRNCQHFGKALYKIMVQKRHRYDLRARVRIEKLRCDNCQKEGHITADCWAMLEEDTP